MIVWFTAAEDDLVRETSFVLARNPKAADKLERRFHTAIDHLDMFPNAGRRGRKPGTREIVLTEFPYIIRYRVKADQVQILRIFHTSPAWAD